MAKKKKPKAGEVHVDFGHPDAQGGGGRPRIPAGEYIAKVKSVKHELSSNDNNMLVWRMELVDAGKHSGTVLTTRTMLEPPKALFNLRNLLTAMGKTVPDKAVNLKLKNYFNEEVGIGVQDEEYEGSVYSDIKDFIDPEIVRGNDVDDEDEDLEEDDEDLEDEEEEDEEDEDLEEEDDEDLDEVDL